MASSASGADEVARARKFVVNILGLGQIDNSLKTLTAVWDEAKAEQKKPASDRLSFEELLGKYFPSFAEKKLAAVQNARKQGAPSNASVQTNWAYLALLMADFYSLTGLTTSKAFDEELPKIIWKGQADDVNALKARVFGVSADTPVPVASPVVAVNQAELAAAIPPPPARPPPPTGDGEEDDEDPKNMVDLNQLTIAPPPPPPKLSLVKRLEDARFSSINADEREKAFTFVKKASDFMVQSGNRDTKLYQGEFFRTAFGLKGTSKKGSVDIVNANLKLLADDMEALTLVSQNDSNVVRFYMPAFIVLVCFRYGLLYDNFPKIWRDEIDRISGDIKVEPTLLAMLPQIAGDAVQALPLNKVNVKEFMAQHLDQTSYTWYGDKGMRSLLVQKGIVVDGLNEIVGYFTDRALNQPIRKSVWEELLPLCARWQTYWETLRAVESVDVLKSKMEPSKVDGRIGKSDGLYAALPLVQSAFISMQKDRLGQGLMDEVENRRYSQECPSFDYGPNAPYEKVASFDLDSRVIRGGADLIPLASVLSGRKIQDEATAKLAISAYVAKADEMGVQGKADIFSVVPMGVESLVWMMRRIQQRLVQDAPPAAPSSVVAQEGTAGEPPVVTQQETVPEASVAQPEPTQEPAPATQVTPNPPEPSPSAGSLDQAIDNYVRSLMSDSDDDPETILSDFASKGLSRLRDLETLIRRPGLQMVEASPQVRSDLYAEILDELVAKKDDWILERRASFEELMSREEVVSAILPRLIMYGAYKSRDVPDMDNIVVERRAMELYMSPVQDSQMAPPELVRPVPELPSLNINTESDQIRSMYRDDILAFASVSGGLVTGDHMRLVEAFLFDDDHRGLSGDALKGVFPIESTPQMRMYIQFPKDPLSKLRTIARSMELVRLAKQVLVITAQATIDLSNLNVEEYVNWVQIAILADFNFRDSPFERVHAFLTLNGQVENQVFLNGSKDIRERRMDTISAILEAPLRDATGEALYLSLANRLRGLNPSQKQEICLALRDVARPEYNEGGGILFNVENFKRAFPGIFPPPQPAPADDASPAANPAASPDRFSEYANSWKRLTVEQYLSPYVRREDVDAILAGKGIAGNETMESVIKDRSLELKNIVSELEKRQEYMQRLERLKQKVKIDEGTVQAMIKFWEGLSKTANTKAAWESGWKTEFFGKPLLQDQPVPVDSELQVLASPTIIQKIDDKTPIDVLETGLGRSTALAMKVSKMMLPDAVWKLEYDVDKTSFTTFPAEIAMEMMEDIRLVLHDLNPASVPSQFLCLIWGIQNSKIARRVIKLWDLIMGMDKPDKMEHLGVPFFCALFENAKQNPTIMALIRDIIEEKDPKKLTKMIEAYKKDSAAYVGKHVAKKRIPSQPPPPNPGEKTAPILPEPPTKVDPETPGIPVAAVEEVPVASVAEEAAVPAEKEDVPAEKEDEKEENVPAAEEVAVPAEEEEKEEERVPAAPAPAPEEKETEEARASFTGTFGAVRFYEHLKRGRKPVKMTLKKGTKLHEPPKNWGTDDNVGLAVMRKAWELWPEDIYLVSDSPENRKNLLNSWRKIVSKVPGFKELYDNMSEVGQNALEAIEADPSVLYEDTLKGDFARMAYMATNDLTMILLSPETSVVAMDTIVYFMNRAANAEDEPDAANDVRSSIISRVKTVKDATFPLFMIYQAFIEANQTLPTVGLSKRFEEFRKRLALDMQNGRVEDARKNLDGFRNGPLSTRYPLWILESFQRKTSLKRIVRDTLGAHVSLDEFKQLWQEEMEDIRNELGPPPKGYDMSHLLIDYDRFEAMMESLTLLEPTGTAPPPAVRAKKKPREKRGLPPDVNVPPESVEEIQDAIRGSALPTGEVLPVPVADPENDPGMVAAASVYLEELAGSSETTEADLTERLTVRCLREDIFKTRTSADGLRRYVGDLLYDFSANLDELTNAPKDINDLLRALMMPQTWTLVPTIDAVHQAILPEGMYFTESFDSLVNAILLHIHDEGMKAARRLADNNLVFLTLTDVLREAFRRKGFTLSENLRGISEDHLWRQVYQSISHHFASSIEKQNLAHAPVLKGAIEYAAGRSLDRPLDTRRMKGEAEAHVSLDVESRLGHMGQQVTSQEVAQRLRNYVSLSKWRTSETDAVLSEMQSKAKRLHELRMRAFDLQSQCNAQNLRVEFLKGRLTALDAELTLS